ncbi:hypothetical protein ACRAWC_18170 [Leifsonia sp. L25]|uniref:hypothetical protein n=1 Tax=Actinomycetes TaxID=1760 RepID=UPI003D68E7B1
MNHEQYVAAMSALGYSRADAEGLIWLSKNATDVVLRRNNFVPRGDGLYEIWIANERDYFRRVRKDGREFLGTLGEAYELIYEQVRKGLEAHPGAQRNSK